MGEAAALASAMAWAGTGVGLAHLRGGCSAPLLSASRLLLATPLFLLLAIQAGGFGELTAGGAAPLLAMVASGLIGYGLGDTTYIAAMPHVGLIRLAPTTTAVWVALSTAGAILLLDEPFAWGLLAGGSAVVVGTYLIVARAAAPLPLPDDRARWGTTRTVGAVVLVAAAWAGATLLLAGGRGALGVATVGAVRLPVGGAALAAYTLASTRGRALQRLPRGRDLLIIALVGCVGSGLGALCYIYAVAEAGAARAVVLNTTSPVMAVPLSIVLLRERPKPLILLGAVVCFAGTLVVILG